MTSNVKLLPLPEMHSRFYPMDWHAIEALATDYARACVEANTEALRAEVEGLKQTITRVNESCIRWADDAVAQEDRAILAEAHAEQLAEALREMLVFYGERVDAECRTKDWRELEAISAARAALEQEEWK